MGKPAADLLGDIEADIEKHKSKKLRNTIVRLIVFAMVMAALPMVFLKLGHQYYRRAAFYPTAIMVLLIQFFIFPFLACFVSVCINLMRYNGRIDSEKVFNAGNAILIVLYSLEIPYWIFVIFKYVF